MRISWATRTVCLTVPGGVVYGTSRTVPDGTSNIINVYKYNSDFYFLAIFIDLGILSILAGFDLFRCTSQLAPASAQYFTFENLDGPKSYGSKFSRHGRRRNVMHSDGDMKYAHRVHKPEIAQYHAD